MFWVGKKHFVSIADYEDRFMEVNPKDLMSPALIELLSSIPKDETSRYTIQGNERYRNKDYESAVDNYTKAIELKYDNIEALYYRGLCYIKLEKYNNCVTDLTKIIDIHPDFVEAYFYRANARAALQTFKQLKDAILDYSIVLEDNDKNGLCYYLRGYCYLQLQKDTLAYSDWKNAKVLGVAQESEANWKNDYLHK
ncbi:tetratricopeptide repeat protein [Mucilaginibacter sp.]|jgi:tetratricopeptide (TPR) repeat protein|uniref:tetratricopeptide repeat protein n=1 Tax=Mucilaginibacter sp. TaxID=1882438 RepID=UPI003561C3B2